MYEDVLNEFIDGKRQVVIIVCVVSVLSVCVSLGGWGPKVFLSVGYLASTYFPWLCALGVGHNVVSYLDAPETRSLSGQPRAAPEYDTVLRLPMVSSRNNFEIPLNSSVCSKGHHLHAIDFEECIRNVPPTPPLQYITCGGSMLSIHRALPTDICRYVDRCRYVSLVGIRLRR